jgi:predicted nucleotidyltransferase
MLTISEIQTIASIVEPFRVKQVLLFGSALLPAGQGRDIDLAVSGVAPSAFYRLYGELLCALSRPVDLVDLDTETAFTRLIRREGVPIYGGLAHAN